MKIGRHSDELVAWDEDRAAWARIGGPWDRDVLALLGDERAADEVPRLAAQASESAPPPAGLPFTPASLRGVMIVEEHFTRAARTMVRRFMPAPVDWVMRGYEGVTRRTFPPIKPAPRFYEVPSFYFGNPTTFIPDGAEVRRPGGSRFLDFELELGAVVTRRWDATLHGRPAAADVIGGFVVINDWSARDTQFADERRGPFGGAVKAKSFATGIGPVVVSADEILPRWDRVTGRVLVNDEVWCEGSTAGGRFSLDEVVGHIAQDEWLVPGEVISLGTLAGCCGLELDRFLEPGDVVRLELDGIGSLTNTVTA